MCGLFGSLAATPGTPVEQRLNDVLGALSHRGPDSHGTWFDGSAGIAFAHTRLAVIDPSPAGAQPIMSRDGRMVLCYNGEIYNYRDMRKVLETERPDLEMTGDSDSRVLIEACAHWGVEATVTRCIGMFAFAVWDRREQELYLVRDRVGIKPLYWGRLDGAFLFASELKGMLAFAGRRPEIDRDALASYTRYGYVPAPQTIYRDFCKLEPGAMLRMRRGREPVISTWWSMDRAVRDGLAARIGPDEAPAVSALDKLAGEAVRARMIADVPLGAFLSGGIDSSLVVALMQAASPRPVHTFSIGFREPEFDESADARRVAAHLGTDHTEFHVTPVEAMDAVREMPLMFDEPFSDASQVPTYLVSRLTRRQVTVALSGDGGDELFAGYDRYRLARRLLPFSAHLPGGRAWRRLVERAPLHRINAFFASLPDPLRSVDLGDKLARLAALPGADGIGMYQSLVSQWDDQDAIATGSRRAMDIAAAHRSMLNGLDDPVEQMQFLDSVAYLPDDILTKVDRASMAVSLEVRVPLLDHRLVEYAWTLPPSLKLRGSGGKWILRRVLERYVPAHLTERPKKGFFLPIDRWLRGEMKAWAAELLTRRKLDEHGLFNSELVIRKWNEHLSGRRNWRKPLWNVLMYQAWHEHWAG